MGPAAPPFLDKAHPIDRLPPGFWFSACKPFLCRRIAADVETKGIQRRAEKLDLRFGRFGRGFFFLPDELRHHQSGQ